MNWESDFLANNNNNTNNSNITSAAAASSTTITTTNTQNHSPTHSNNQQQQQQQQQQTLQQHSHPKLLHSSHLINNSLHLNPLYLSQSQSPTSSTININKYCANNSISTPSPLINLMSQQEKYLKENSSSNFKSSSQSQFTNVTTNNLSSSSSTAIINSNQNFVVVDNSELYNQYIQQQQQQQQQQSQSNLDQINETINLIKRLNIKLIAFDFDCTIVTTHTGGQWLDAPEKLAEFVRPCFRDLMPVLLKCPDLNICVVTYSPQEKLIRDVLRISMKDEYDVNNLIERIIIKGNTKEFLNQHGIETCYTNGKQPHLEYCREYFQKRKLNQSISMLNSSSNSNISLNGTNSRQNTATDLNKSSTNNTNNNTNNNKYEIKNSNILLIDDDVNNLNLAIENGHFAYQVNNNMELSDFIKYLREEIKKPINS